MRFLPLFGLLMLTTTVFAADLGKPHVIGAPADTQIYVFSSPSCPHCATYHRAILPTLQEAARAGRAQIRLVSMPGDPRSLKAATIAACLPETAYIPYMERVFNNQAYWLSGKDPTLMLTGYARASGADEAALTACLSDTNLATAIQTTGRTLGRLYQISGLPTTVVIRAGSHQSFIGADPRILPQIEALLPHD